MPESPKFRVSPRNFGHVDQTLDKLLHRPIPAAVLEQPATLIGRLARAAALATAAAIVALVCGLVPAYSSTTRVVLPAFLPLGHERVAALRSGL